MRKILTALLFFNLAIGQLWAQNRNLTGKITDENGKPIAQASVLVKGTTVGTLTSADGLFSIAVPAKAKTLVISSLNYGSQEIAITTKSSYNVSLKSSASELDEVVVVGYGTQKKNEATSAITKVAGERVEQVPLTSVDQILQGKSAGVQSVTFSGQPGANQQIRIRGVGSYALSAQPLYVVDGVQINSGDLSRETTTTNVLAQINPDDIESISILKDAAATGIYGSRGSNGVIVITTKQGKAGKTQFKFTAEEGNNTHGPLPSAGIPVNATDWLNLYQESIVNAGYTQAQAAATAANYSNGGTVNTDWLNLITRTGVQKQYNLSAQGGNENTTFFASAGYFKQEANVIGSDLTRYSSTINLNHKVGKKLSISLGIKPTYTKENAPLSNSSAFSNPVMEIYFLRPTMKAFNDDGSYNIEKTSAQFASLYNPLYIVSHDIHTADITSVNGNAEIKYNILDNLTFTSKNGVQYQSLEEYYYNNTIMGDGFAANGRGYAYYTRYFLYNLTNQIDYRASLTKNKDLTFNATAGYEAIQSRGYFISAQTNNFATPALQYSVTASTPIAGTASGSDYNFSGIFSRANLNFRSKYDVQFSFRHDGSSRFSSAHQYGDFPTISGAWNLSKENFFSKIGFISDAKIRASYGVTGNAELGNYAWLQTYGFGANYAGSPGGVFNGIGNTNLQWESSKQTDVGADVSFLKGRLNVVVDYYKRNIDQLIFNFPLSQSTGFSTITANVGGMQNTGIEFTLNATPVLTKNFKWDFSFNITNNKNQVTALPPGQTSVANGNFNLKAGHDFYEFYMRQWAGVDPATGSPLWYADSSKTNTTTSYNAAAKSYTGKSASPKYYGGLNNSFTYKQLTLSVDFYYNFGNYVYDTWAAYLNDEVNSSYGKYSAILNRWTTPGQITNVPKLVYGSTNFSASTSSRFLYKGDYIRLRNIQLSYKAGADLTKKLHMSSLSFYARGSNLWTKIYDNNLPFDPEQNINSSANLNFFINKAVTAGVVIGF